MKSSSYVRGLLSDTVNFSSLGAFKRSLQLVNFDEFLRYSLHRRKLPPNTGGVMALSPPLSSLSSPPFPDSLPSPPLPSPSLRSRAPEIQLEGMGRAVSSHSGVWGGAQPKSNLEL